MIDDGDGEGRISRWSKRKMAVAQEQAAEDADAEEQAKLDDQLQAELQANREAAEAVDLETLNADSDFSVFMKNGVPKMLKRQAMASLWRTNPIFANVDGLVDYDDDFASPDLVMKTFKSAYQAGKGYLDLLKEDEEPNDQEAVEATEVEQIELLEEEADDPTIESQNDESDVVVVAQEGATEMLAEQEPPPKVSLRKRLELERPS